MNIDELVKHLKAEIEARKLNWLAEKIGSLIFIYGPRRNEINSDNLAIISFLQTPPLLEITNEGKKSESTINAMWKKYQINQEEDDIDTQQDKTMAKVILWVAIGIAVICLLGTAGGLYLGYLLTN